MKIVISRSHGGFGLSEKAIILYGKKKGLKIVKDEKDSSKFSEYYYIDEIKDGNIFLEWKIQRNDPHLIETIEELGKEANGNHSDLKIVEIPDDVEWILEESYGKEWVAEDHRRWS